MSNKLDSTVEDILNTTTNIEDPHTRSSQVATLKSMEIVKLGIERYVLQIQQLINLEVSAENPDLKLIEKCNNVDVPKISKAISSCGSALEKYIKIPGMDENYIDQVSMLMPVNGVSELKHCTLKWRYTPSTTPRETLLVSEYLLTM